MAAGGGAEWGPASRASWDPGCGHRGCAVPPGCRWWGDVAEQWRAESKGYGHRGSDQAACVQGPFSVACPLCYC